MKNTLKKITASILSSAVIIGSAAGASASAVQPVQEQQTMPMLGIVETIRDFFAELGDFFTGFGPVETSVGISVEKGKVFENLNPFDSAHASTLVKLNDGRIISAWFGGSGEGADDVRIRYAIYDGNEWGEVREIETTDTVAHWNPVLENCGSYIRLYYKVGVDTKCWVTKYVDSFDNGATWTAPAELVEGDTSGGRGPVKNKTLVTSDGVIIAPASTEQGDWKAFFDISEDGGVTWTKTDYVEAVDENGNTVQMIQPALWEDKDGGIHAMFRTKSGRIYRSDSTDGGYTWCPAYATELKNNNSGIDCVMTDNGWLWLAYNPIGINGFRNRLVLAVSKDNGKTWEDVTVLESTLLNPFGEYSYPAIVADGNELYITYTYNRNHINYAFIEFEG